MKKHLAFIARILVVAAIFGLGGWWYYRNVATPHAFADRIMEDARNGSIHSPFMRYEHFDPQLLVNMKARNGEWMEDGETYEADEAWLVFARGISDFNRIEHDRTSASVWRDWSIDYTVEDMLESYYKTKPGFVVNEDSTRFRFQDEPTDHWIYVFRAETMSGPVRQQVHIMRLRGGWKLVGATYESI